MKNSSGSVWLIFNENIIAFTVSNFFFLFRTWFKKGAIVLDVGTNAVDDATKKAGYKLVGDCEFEVARAAGNVKAMTPVPGGVGPMTVTMLLRNTITAFKKQTGKQ